MRDEVFLNWWQNIKCIKKERKEKGTRKMMENYSLPFPLHNASVMEEIACCLRLIHLDGQQHQQCIQGF